MDHLIIYIVDYYSCDHNSHRHFVYRNAWLILRVQIAGKTKTTKHKETKQKEEKHKR